MPTHCGDIMQCLDRMPDRPLSATLQLHDKSVCIDAHPHLSSMTKMYVLIGICWRAALCQHQCRLQSSRHALAVQAVCSMTNHCYMSGVLAPAPRKCACGTSLAWPAPGNGIWRDMAYASADYCWPCSAFSKWTSSYVDPDLAAVSGEGCLYRSGRLHMLRSCFPWLMSTAMAGCR